MDYIMISMLTISIFTYIVYMLANKILAIQMHIKFVILCAVCACSISLILPRMFVGFAGFTGTLCIIILFGLISSYFIARYYDAELQKAPVKNTLVANSMEIIETIEPDIQDPLQSTSALTMPSLETVLKNTQESTENLKTITESIIKEYFYPVQYKEKDECWKLVKVENIVQLPILEAIPVMTEIGVKEYFYPIKYEEGIISSILEKLANMDQQKKSEEVFEILVEKNEEIEVFNDLMELNNKENIEEKVIECSNSKVISEEVYPSSTDLDVLMDVAFLQKEQRNFLQALKTFRQALILYPNSEVAPFLVIEIGTILKNFGSYNDAIQVFTEGRLLPGVINNMNLEQEFINNIAYLRVVKNVLIKNSLEFSPLSEIPLSALKEIDAEFCEWRSQS